MKFNEVTLDEWFDHIKTVHATRTDLTLARMHQVATRLQVTTFSCPVIAIAGTNGKGSVAKTLESIYTQAGFSVGLYTSPHLMHFHERIRINHQNCRDEDLLRAFAAVENARDNIALSFFEFITLATLFLFRQAKLDVIILEAGLGGRLDAVNVVENNVAVITSIALDHTQLLGNTRELIAYEKACIARHQQFFICGDDNPPAIIEKIAREKNTEFLQLNRDFFYHTTDSHFIFHGKNEIERLFSLPHLKPQNIAIALAVIDVMQPKLVATENNIAHGIANTDWPGRFECHAVPIPCVLDVAHNPASANWLAKQYQRLPCVPKTIAVIGMLADKVMAETIQPMLSWVDEWLVCDLTAGDIAGRGSDGQIIMQCLQSHQKQYRHFASVFEAMHALQSLHCQSACDRALIFGSFRVVSEAKQWLSNQNSS